MPRSAASPPVDLENSLSVLDAVSGIDPQDLLNRDRWSVGLKPRPIRVAAVMTTTPLRIGMIRPAVESVLNQQHPVDVFYLVVPQTSRRSHQAWTIPSWVIAGLSPRLRLLRPPIDLGPASDVIAALAAEDNRFTYIWKTDDDELYEPLILRMLLQASAVFPGRALTTYSKPVWSYFGGAMMQGWSGLLLQRAFLDDSLTDFWTAPGDADACRNQDDVWYTAHFAKRGIRRQSLPGGRRSSALHDISNTGALFVGSATGLDNHQNSFLCAAALVDRYPELWQPRRRLALFIACGHDENRALEWTLAQTRLPQELYLVDAGYSIGDQAAAGAQLAHVGDWFSGFVVSRIRCSTESADWLSRCALDFEEDHETVIVMVPPDIWFSTELPNVLLQKHEDALDGEYNSRDQVDKSNTLFSAVRSMNVDNIGVVSFFVPRRQLNVELARMPPSADPRRKDYSSFGSITLHVTLDEWGKNASRLSHVPLVLELIAGQTVMPHRVYLVDRTGLHSQIPQDVDVGALLRTERLRRVFHGVPVRWLATDGFSAAAGIFGSSLARSRADNPSVLMYAAADRLLEDRAVEEQLQCVSECIGACWCRDTHTARRIHDPALGRLPLTAFRCVTGPVVTCDAFSTLGFECALDSAGKLGAVCDWIHGDTSK